MKHLWSPWRMKYFSEKNKGCIFCRVQKQPAGVENLVLFRHQRAFVILNRFPYTSGHMMVVANSHRPSLEDLDRETRAEMMELSNTCMSTLRKVYSPQGFNVGSNIGESAGAGIKEHIHIHIVPRWVGDTNFISTLGEIRVLPESLEETYRRLAEAWEWQS